MKPSESHRIIFVLMRGLRHINQQYWSIDKYLTEYSSHRIAVQLLFTTRVSEINYQCYSSGTMTAKEGLVQESCNGLDVLD